MDRFEKTSPRPNQPVRARDIRQIPRDTLMHLRNNSTTQISRYGENTMIKTKAVAESLSTGLRIEKVLALPPIPTSGGRFVFWTSEGAGTGDDQIWVAYAGQTAWTPMQKYTTKSGTPV